ncbi:Hypothetical predicted protein [Pelobates cultripes]|uniref:Uncharacterized protein n=1 Tax=Pelobates cultripes TaxID=61616 RepID=A0AAD1VNR8_PELCU|nr:Hypothetical predicted protein [Pelobates cultripes]
MPAQRRPQPKGTSIQQPHQPTAAMDQLCERFWAILCSRGATPYQAMKAVGTWIRPATRRRYYGMLLRTPKTATWRDNGDRPTKWAATPGHADTNTCPHTSRNWGATLNPHKSTSPDPRPGVLQDKQLPSKELTAYQQAVSRHMPPPMAGTLPLHRSATEYTCSYGQCPQHQCLENPSGHAGMASRMDIK